MTTALRALGLCLVPLLLLGIVADPGPGVPAIDEPGVATELGETSRPDAPSAPRRAPASNVATDCQNLPRGDRRPALDPETASLRVEGLRDFRRSLEEFTNSVPAESRDLLMEALVARFDEAHSQAMDQYVRNAGHRQPDPLDELRLAFDAMEQLDGIEPTALALEFAAARLGRPVAASSLAEVAAMVGRQRQVRANESAAIATLENISSAQAQCQASAVIDANRNGAGEFGTFAELSGAVPVRGSRTRHIEPPVLSAAFRRVESRVVVRSGYVFQMWLPQTRTGVYVHEAPSGGMDEGLVGNALCEVVWRCYAWPLEYGASGKRVFVVDQNGDVLGSQNASRWSGVGNGPHAGAANGPEPFRMSANQTSPSGEFWEVIG